MKRFCALILTLALMAAFPAQAATWFSDGEMLHSDPFCVDRKFCFDTYYTPALECSTEVETMAAGLPICESCAISGEAAEELYAPVVWYYNPDGGRFYHRDQNCASIHSKFLPLSGVYVAESRSWVPENPCSFCGAGLSLVRGPADYIVWEATVEEKAALLSGVWTLPSAEAISFTAAVEAAEKFLRAMLDEEEYLFCVLHYDQGGPEGAPETWKVVAATPLRMPVCVVYVDALTGEVYHHQLAEEYAAQLP